MDAERENTMPEAIDMAEAVALMDDASEPEEAQEHPASPEASHDEELAQEAEPSEAEGEAGEAPEFWSSEDKAAWNAVPPELPPVPKTYAPQPPASANTKPHEP